jgi:hypothetical protein
MTDTMNNITRELKLPEGSYVFDIVPTFDHKIFISSRHDAEEHDFMLLKYNDSLQYDSVYSSPYTYDSLCPGGITSGTIELSCNIITDLKNQSINGVPKLKLSPNPASGYTVIYLPELVSVKSKSNRIAQSFKSDYVKDLEMSVFDSDAKAIHTMDWPDNTKETVLNISGWKSGMYFIRILKNNDLILTGKLIVK